MMKYKLRTWYPLLLLLLPSFAWAGGPTFNTSAIMLSLSDITIVTQSIAIVTGVFFIFSAFMHFKRYGEARTMMSGQHSIAKPLFKLIAGILLMALPTTTQVVLNAFWGTSSVMAYQPSNTDFANMMPPVILFIRLIGVWAIIKGCTLLTRLGGEGSQPGTGSKAIMHLLGGVLCVNIIATCNTIEWIFFGT